MRAMIALALNVATASEKPARGAMTATPRVEMDALRTVWRRCVQRTAAQVAAVLRQELA